MDTSITAVNNWFSSKTDLHKYVLVLGKGLGWSKFWVEKYFMYVSIYKRNTYFSESAG